MKQNLSLMAILQYAAQLDVINKLPEWSSKHSGLPEKIENQHIAQSVSKKKFELLQKEETINDKDSFLRTIPLLEVQRENITTSSLKRSNSLPNISQQQPLISEIERKSDQGQKNNLSTMSKEDKSNDNSYDFNSFSAPEMYGSGGRSNRQRLEDITRTLRATTRWGGIFTPRKSSGSSIEGSNTSKALEPSIDEPGPSGYKELKQEISVDDPSTSHSSAKNPDKVESPIKSKTENLFSKIVRPTCLNDLLKNPIVNSKNGPNPSGLMIHDKKKRKSKENSSKKKVKKLRKANIMFTVGQISNMIDLIKIFQTGIST
ncbi:uncharacterized protein NPIL_136641 [Nephila pilipes]|uniref:Uncharacterized protein n=1 Tax=Nephila pilipes TaxID=299642 RepID=A0A8X6UV29_NEPPI|nr:uncharacterized protein NPIL_136641 [Nephila pilipes]